MKKFCKIITVILLLLLFCIGLRSITGCIIKNMYPLKYKEYILQNAEKNNLDPYFVMAVIKAESNYDTQAHSGIARGLMQITDDTAVWIAEKIGIEFDNKDIENPELNIKMGCYYLRYLLDIYTEPAVALAAYNAGMGNVSKWLDDARYSKDSVTLYAIPFDETRKYVEKVFKYENIYKKLYTIKEEKQ